MSDELWGAGERRRLKVFEAITEPQVWSRVLRVRVQDGYSVCRAFGPLRSCEETADDEVVVHFFDLRHSRSAYDALATAAFYEADFSSDAVVLPFRDFISTPGLEALLPSFGDVASSMSYGLQRLTQYFDLRAAELAAGELTRIGLSPVITCASRFEQSECIEFPAFENTLYSVQLQSSDLDASISSKRTLASSCLTPWSSSYSGDSLSPYIESPSDEAWAHRRKPRKKPMDDKDKALYELCIPRILDGSDTRTTVMIKNIPNKYTQKMLLTAIDRHFSDTYDFFYLPIDFKNKCNVGYAFVNFREPTTIPAFYNEKNGKKWEHFKSEKICAIAYARIQGKAALMQHFQSSSVMSQEDQKIWLLVACSTLLGFRVTHIIWESHSVEDMYEPWCFNLFTSDSKLHTFLVTCILYPFFLGWVLLGTVWYAIVQAETKCFKDPQQSWYIMLWLIIFYIWIIAYTTAITTSVMVYLRQRQMEGQYTALIEQYGELEHPDLRAAQLWQSDGLTPAAISRFEPHTVTEEQAGTYVCSICIEEAKLGDRIRTIDCGHSFHMACIDPWLLRHTECPNCKRSLRRVEDQIEEPLLANENWAS